MKELVFGHKNPDTDAICAAKAYSYKISADLKLKPLPLVNQTKRQNLFWITSRNPHLA